MAINLTIRESKIIIKTKGIKLAPRHENQLSFWGFNDIPDGDMFSCELDNPDDLLIKLANYFKQNDFDVELDETTEAIFKSHSDALDELTCALSQGEQLKNGKIDSSETDSFVQFLNNNIQRQLKDHQLKASLHLLAVKNGANFSVPGSGKTTVVLTIFEKYRSLGQIDSLFVVGPPSCFGPWLTEYEEVLGKKPTFEILAGGDVEDRQYKYNVEKESACDLYLTTFQTLHRDWRFVKNLLKLHKIKFYLVIDEAHYIKQLDGTWAGAVLKIAPFAKRRCILTGTPFPRSFTDSFNLFDFLWPESPPLSSSDKNRIEYFSKKKETSNAASIIDTKIGPLFYRVRKSELNLAPQIFHDPIVINMNKYERLVYSSITDQVRTLSQSDYLNNFDLLMRLIKGRMMRIRQCTSYIKLLSSAILDYKEDLLGTNLSLSQIIKNYDDMEIPAKLEALLELVKSLHEQGEKIVVWSNFIESLKLIKEALTEQQIKAQLIYGATPTQNSSVSDELTREGIIREFLKKNGQIDVLVANPAACAESISLHKECAHAIYYDLSYNCAQYLQSLDRIHRVGGSENKQAHYYFLQYVNTIDADILHNVQKKAENMSYIVDQDYAIYSLDMFDEEDELSAYERIFGKQ